MRLPLVDVAALSPSEREAVDWAPQARTVPHIVAHARDTFIPLYRALMSLRDSPDLDPELHEFVEMAAAASAGCEYIWSRHEASLRSFATSEQVEALRSGESFEGSEGIVIAFVADLFNGRHPDDERLAEVLEEVSVRALIEAILEFGLYSTFARIIEVAGIPTDDRDVVLAPRVGRGGVEALYATDDR
jgi:hypothetical protein